MIRPKSGLSEKEKPYLENNGRLSRKTIQRLCRQEVNPDVLMGIMERFDMLIPYRANSKSSETKVHEYLVPCMMKRVPPEKLPQREHGHIPILFFRFAYSDTIEEGREQELFLPNGLFHRVVSRCYQNYKEWSNENMATYYDYMEFGTYTGINFSLRMAYDSILLCAIKIDSYETEDQILEELSNLREKIQLLIDGVVNAVFPNLTCVHYLECISQKHEHRYIM